MVLSIGAAAAFVTPSGFAGRGCMERGTGGGRATLAGGRSSGISMAVLDIGSMDELDKIIKTDSTDKLVVVDYSTTWCGPCKLILPMFEELSIKYEDAIFLKVIGDSTNDASQLMKREGVRSVPSFHFWKGGKKVDSVNGANEDALLDTVRSLV